MHQIWVIVDDKGKMQHCWEAPDPADPKNPEEPAITLNPMPPGWKIMKIKAPGLLKQFQEEAGRAGKSLSKFILDECQVDEAARPEKPEGLPPEILYREIKRKGEG